MPPGAFIIRFSEGHPGWLAVAFMKPARRTLPVGALDKIDGQEEKNEPNISKQTEAAVQHCLIEVKASHFVIFMAHGQIAFNSLTELILNCQRLRSLPTPSGFVVSKHACFDETTAKLDLECCKADGRDETDRIIVATNTKSADGSRSNTQRMKK